MKIQMYLNKLASMFLHIYKTNKENFVLKLILGFSSIFYLLVYKIRLQLYEMNLLKTVSLDSVVISVGNITTGGTGKTPIVIELTKYFIANGYKVAVLSRGYKRKTNGLSLNEAVLISDGEEILTDHEISGDEPYLIAKNVPKAIVIVGKDRIKAGKAAIRLGANILILDDGYQYIRLNRDENILLLDSYNPFDNYCLLPQGKLRELPESLSRSTAIIFSNADKATLQEKDTNILRHHAPEQPIIRMNYRIRNFSSLNTKRTMSTKEIASLKAIVICGIANPKSFHDSLKALNIDIVNLIAFPDHHDYTIDDFQEIIQIAELNKIENIIITEKDSIKLNRFCETAPFTIWVGNLEVIFDVSSPFEKILVNRAKWVKKVHNLPTMRK